VAVLIQHPELEHRFHISSYRRFFVPITGKDSAQEIREYFIPDFSNWKDHDLYQKAFDRLMRDLKANPEAPAHTRQ